MEMPSLRPSPTALLNPCADPIFKILFTDESKESNIALTSFLTDIIGKKVSNVVLQPNELSGEAVTDKQSEFDINCKIDGKIVNIEMQGLNKDNHFGKRAEYHVSHLFNHYVTKGLDWTVAPQAFQISVLNFIFDDSEEDCISHYLMKNQNGRIIAGMLNVIFMELPKIEPVSDDISLLTPVQMWGKFFLYASNPAKREFVEKLAERNRGIKMAVTVLKNISQDEINWYHETRYWMHVSDEKTMLNEAKRKGIAEGIKQVAQNAIKAGLPAEQIAKLTGLTVDEINNLK
ncbi:MAG: Rpn family recombination-promoting nuclease/putative transposase [Treponema sp.]|nr:Rpn family recombination-promoting nuclease/putative transposase [Treponema sp.]